MKFTILSLVAAGTVALAACVPTDQPYDHDAALLASGQEKLATCISETCTTLNLDGARLPDYDVLGALTHVDALMISYTNFGELADIADMTQLRELHIGRTSVTDLSALPGFANLRLLHAQGLDVSDYEYVAQLSNLEELVIGSFALTDISFVSGLTQLKSLDLSGSRVTDLSPLSGHPTLETLELVEMDSSDLAPLLTMPNLRHVSIPQHIAESYPDRVEALRAKGIIVEIAVEIMIVC